MSCTPRTAEALAATLAAGFDLGPEHRVLTELCRELERETNTLRRQLAEQSEVMVLLRDLVATIDLHTDCMTGTIDREALDPYIEQAERWVDV